VVDTHSYDVVARVPQASPFSPSLAVSRDGAEVWFTLKDSGKSQDMTAQEPFGILTTLDTGPITNHVTLVDNADGKFAYVTVGGENAVKLFRRGEHPELISTIATGDLPHRLWPSGDGSRAHVVLENQDAVITIDTLMNRVIITVPVGRQPQTLVYTPDAVPEADGDGTANLVPLGEARKASPPVLVVVSTSGHECTDTKADAFTGERPGTFRTQSEAASTPPRRGLGKRTRCRRRCRCPRRR
jgi:hypothetical protein